MKYQDFEQQLKKQMANFEVKPSQEVWKKLKPNLPQNQNRKFWWISIIAVGILASSTWIISKQFAQVSNVIPQTSAICLKMSNQTQNKLFAVNPIQIEEAKTFGKPIIQRIAKQSLKTSKTNFETQIVEEQAISQEILTQVSNPNPQTQVLENPKKEKQVIKIQIFRTKKAKTQDLNEDAQVEKLENKSKKEVWRLRMKKGLEKKISKTSSDVKNFLGALKDKILPNKK